MVMSEEQIAYIKAWIAQNIHIKEDRWLGKDYYNNTEIDHLWYVDEESFQMKRFLRCSFNVDDLSSEDKALYNDALSLCSYIDELSEIVLYSVSYEGETPEKTGSNIKERKI